MPKYADLLRGARVQSCERDGDSLVLTFAAQRLIVHNQWEIRHQSRMHLDCFDLIGVTVNNVATSDTELILECGEVSVWVDLTPTAWSGPEAAVLYSEGHPVVVWS